MFSFLVLWFDMTGDTLSAKALNNATKALNEIQACNMRVEHFPNDLQRKKRVGGRAQGRRRSRACLLKKFNNKVIRESPTARAKYFLIHEGRGGTSGVWWSLALACFPLSCSPARYLPNLYFSLFRWKSSLAGGQPNVDDDSLASIIEAASLGFASSRSSRDGRLDEINVITSADRLSFRRSPSTVQHTVGLASSLVQQSRRVAESERCERQQHRVERHGAAGRHRLPPLQSSQFGREDCIRRRGKKSDLKRNPCTPLREIQWEEREREREAKRWLEETSRN